MSKRIDLNIDGTNATVPAGSTIMEAAQSVGIDIPRLCYDPALCLAPSSSCRLCVVEVEGARALATSCSHPASPGMVVSTDSELLRETRRMVIDLLLSDHPHDCLTCEKSGECALQDYAYQFGIKEPEYVGDQVKSEPVQDGPAIICDRSKCILCGRCVTVCHDIQVSGAIDFLHRGFTTRVGLPLGQTREESTCVECGNCIDVCPTGALTSARALGTGRAWELKQVMTTCPYCGVGCTMALNVRGNEVVKITGKPGVGVNNGNLCVKGRFGYEFISHQDRLTQPLIRRGGDLLPATWDEALDYVAERLGEIVKQHGTDSVGGMLSARCTNEENYVMQKFLRAVIKTNNVDHCARLCHASTVAGLAQAFGSGAMTNPIEDFDKTDAIFIIGSNTTECHPIIGSAIKRAAKRGVPIIVADPRAIELTEYAVLWLRQKHGTDSGLINAFINVILSDGLQDREFIAKRTEGFDSFRTSVESYTPEVAEKITGVPAQDIITAARIYAKAEAASLVYSMGITQHICGTDNVLALANLAMVTGNIGKPGAGVNPLRGQNNVQGACDMGSLPNVLPGYQRIDDADVRAKFERAWGTNLSSRPGLTLMEMMNAAHSGDMKALYVMGENPVLSDPDIKHVEEALKNLDLLVVQDIFLTETAQLADVVLPAVSFAEKDGTFTNTERRVQMVRKAIDPPGEARTDWQIICDLSRRMGYDMAYSGPAAIMDEIASLTPSFAGISFERLEQGGIQWPCPGPDHPGTPILHAEKFTRGLGKFHPVEFIPPAEMPDEEYPFVLSTGRILEHYHTGTMSRRSEVLDALVPAGVVEISPEDAARLRIAPGGWVKVASRRGQIEIQADVTKRVSPGTVFIAFHYRESPANRLTIAALDPVAKIPELKVCAVRIELMEGGCRHR